MQHCSWDTITKPTQAPLLVTGVSQALLESTVCWIWHSVVAVIIKGSHKVGSPLCVLPQQYNVAWSNISVMLFIAAFTRSAPELLQLDPERSIFWLPCLAARELWSLVSLHNRNKSCLLSTLSVSAVSCGLK